MGGVDFRFRALAERPAQLRYADHVLRIRAYVEAHLDRIESEVKPYPPPVPPPNRYIRTGNLGLSWSRAGATSGAGIDRFITVGGPNAPYARFVVGDYQQSYHQRTGWKKLRDHLHRDEYVAGLRSLYSQLRVSF